MLGFQWECIDSKLNTTQGILQTFMLADYLQRILVSMETWKEFNSRNYMLAFPLMGCWGVLLLAAENVFYSIDCVWEICKHRSLHFHQIIPPF